MTPAFAEPPKYKAKIIPECSLVKTDAGEEVCAYTLEQWKEVLTIDAEFVVVKAKLKKEEERTALLNLQVKDLRGQVVGYAENQTLLLEYTTSCTAERIECDKKYQYERVKPRWGSPLAWTVAAVSTSILIGVVVEKLID